MTSRKWTAAGLAIGVCVGLVVVNAAGGAMVTVDLTPLDANGQELPDYTGPQGVPDMIPDIDPGEAFTLLVEVSGPPEGISGGSVDVTVQPDLELSFTSFAMNPALNVVGDNGSIQNGGAPQLVDIGKGSFFFSGGFGYPNDPDYPGPVEFFTASGTANTTPGMMHFEASQGFAAFAIRGEGNTDDVAWGTCDLNVVPEPSSLVLMAVAGTALLRRRHRRPPIR